MVDFHLHNLGHLDYQAGLQQQAFIHQRICTHPHEVHVLAMTVNRVITMGRRSQEQDLLLSRAEFKARGYQIMDTERGGAITYHGEEQLLLYPLASLTHFKIPLVDYVCFLQHVTICFLSHFHIKAHIQEGCPGVYVNLEKISYLGLRIHQGISTHGVAININGPIEAFSLINSCAEAHRRVTSIAEQKHSPKPYAVLELAKSWYDLFLQEWHFQP